MEIDFDKSGGLVPAIIQDATTMKVLMLGYMNREAYEKDNTDRPGDILQPQPQVPVDKGRDVGQLP